MILYRVGVMVGQTAVVMKFTGRMKSRHVVICDGKIVGPVMTSTMVAVFGVLQCDMQRQTHADKKREKHRAHS